MKNVQKKCKKNTNQSSNQAPPVLTPYALTTQPLPPLLLTVLYSGFINKFLSLIRPIVHIVKIIDLCQTNSRRFYECSIRNLKKCVFYWSGFNLSIYKDTQQCVVWPKKAGHAQMEWVNNKVTYPYLCDVFSEWHQIYIGVSLPEGRPHSKFESDFTHMIAKSKLLLSSIHSKPLRGTSWKLYVARLNIRGVPFGG